ncbi:beta-eliminating lyase [Nemania sp. FL0031]|nr:beta-eliminating lyase [Nemania sp. FL0031]
MNSFTATATPPPPSHCAVVVRSLLHSRPDERKKVLEDVEYNIFAFPAGMVICDYLSDSGTSAMTDVQWATLMRADESYGRNWGYYCLLDAFRDIFERGRDKQRVFHRLLTGTADIALYREKFLFPYQDGFVNGGLHQLERPNFFIVPQGRCAEFLLFSTLMSMIKEVSTPSNSGRPAVVSNGFFDTTAANAASAGFGLQTFTQPGLESSFPQELIGRENPFKGNLDVAATEAFLTEHPGEVVMILLTITNNWAAAQPVSMANIRATASLAKRGQIPLFFDACRFAENALFIQLYEAGYSDKTIPDIVQEMFSYADGFTISLKKDGLANMGGALCFRDKGLFASKYEGIGLQLKERQIVYFGNDSYGGMSGRDLMAAAAGLYEVVKEPYLRRRVTQVQSFAMKLQHNGIAVLSPPGGHAVYLDMEDFFYGCDRKPDDFASVGFTLQLLQDYGIRAAEAGPFGWEWDRKSPEDRKKIPNLVRFAVPRNMMSDEHIDYTVAAIKELYARRHTIPNVEITRGKDSRLRHFQCGMRPIPMPKSPSVTRTYLGEATRQLSLISRAINQPETKKDQLLRAIALATGEWGEKHVSVETGTSRWASNVGNDHSPFEYSVAMDQSTGDAEIRFVVEAQPNLDSADELQEQVQCNAPERLQESALQLNEEIAAGNQATVSLARFNLVRDIFMLPQPKGKFAAWHSYASTKTGSEWKVYLNPFASGGANSDSLAATREAFGRLGLASSWELVERTMSAHDFVLYFSLDLSSTLESARVKVYIAHPATPASEVARKHAAICPGASDYEIQRFCAVMAGGSLGPYSAKPLLSCFAFTTKAPDRPVGTVHFPVDAYADNDAEIQYRIDHYMQEKAVPSIFKERYRKIISGVQRRPLDQGPGIHAWISLKQSETGRLSNTFYLSSELFRAAEGGRVEAS